MNNDDEWSSLLQDHPIFSLPKKLGSSLLEREDSLELSTSTLPKFTNQDPTDDGPTPSGRRQTMVLKDSELILAAGKELRIASLSESRLNKSLRKSYKVSLPLISTDSLLKSYIAYIDTRDTKHPIRNTRTCSEFERKATGCCWCISGRCCCFTAFWRHQTCSRDR